MIAMTTDTSCARDIADAVAQCYRTRDFEPLRSVYAPDVVLDIHPPQWHFQLGGPDNAIQWLHELMDDLPDYRVTWSRTSAGPDIAIVEWEEHSGHEADEQMCRQVDVLHLADGKVIEHAIWCTGVLDAETIERQRREAPMIH